MTFRKSCFTFALFALLACASVNAAPPNIVFILTDDLGWGDIGVLYQNSRHAIPGAPWQSTPNIDKFAAEGAQLPDHYCAAPVCAPSRASILMGVSQGHANVRDNQFDKALENNHNIATVLKQAGYATVAVGKWGLQGGGDGRNDPSLWPAYPTKRGFDFYFGYARHVDGHEHYPKEAPYTQNGKPKEVWADGTNITPGLDKCYTADLWTAWAKRWIIEHHRTNATQPFFMYLAYDTPHAVQELPTQAYPAGGGLHGGMQWLGTPGHMINTASGEIDSWIHPDYRNATFDNDQNPATPEIPWPIVYKRYATAVRRIDNAVGDILKLLQELNIEKDTLVIFTSDNGPSNESYLPNNPFRADFFNSFGPFDGIKRDCWEGGERVPTLARWPGHIAPGTIITRPSISYDWLRTFAEAAGLAAPARADGVSLLPELTGQGVQHDRGYIYVEYYVNGRTPNYAAFAPAHRNRKRDQMQLLRIGNMVGVRYDVHSQADPFEIYDVAVDPKETNNLSTKMPELEQRMKAMVLQSRRPNDSAHRPYDNELVPSDSGVATEKGIEWKSYDGNFPWVPDLETLQPKETGVGEKIAFADENKNSQASFFTGYFQVPTDGDYTFYLKADGGALLRIHDATVIDADFGYQSGEERTGAIRLQKGLHPFRLYYARKGAATPSLDLSWSGPEMAKQPLPPEVLSHASKTVQTKAAGR